MAVDSGNKRYSMMGLGQPVPSMLPIPDGTISAGDRAMLEFLYQGISLTSVIALIALTLESRVQTLTLRTRQ